MREQTIKLETEKKFLEAEILQRKANKGVSGTGTSTSAYSDVSPVEDLMVRQLRLENNELRLRLEEAAAMRTSLMGSFGQNPPPVTSSSAFNIRKDSVISNGNGGATGYIGL